MGQFMLNAWLQIVQSHACLIIYLNQIVLQDNSENNYTCVYFDCESFFCATNVVELKKKWMTGGFSEEAVRDEGNILLKWRIQDMDAKHFDILTRVSSSGKENSALVICLSVLC